MRIPTAPAPPIGACLSKCRRRRNDGNCTAPWRTRRRWSRPRSTSRLGLPDMEEELARYQATKKILDRCPILRERLTEEKAVLYQQLSEANREIRTARKQLAPCRKIQDHAPQMERDTQAAEGRLDSRNKNVSITKRPQAASNRPPGSLRRTQTFERVHIQTLR